MRKGATDEEEPRRLPLVVSPGSRGSSYTLGATTFASRQEAQLVNAFAEKDLNSDYYMVRKRPGYLLNYSVLYVGGDAPLGMYFYPPVTGFPVSILTNKVFNGSTQIPGTLAGGTGNMMRFQGIPTASPLLLIGNGSSSLATAPSFTDGIVLTQIVDVNFPSSTLPGFAYLDGTIYVMTPKGFIYGSKNTDDPTTWDPLNFIKAQAEPDNAVVLAKQLSYVVAVKKWTTEFFYDAGNPTGSPLSPVQGALLFWGCVNADTLQDIDDMLIWVATNKHSSPRVIILQDLHVRIVSTASIDRYLNATISGHNYRALTMKIGGHSFYILTVRGFYNFTLVYDIGEDLWSIWTDANGSYWPIVASTTDGSGNCLLQSAVDGKIFKQEESSIFPNDNGVVVPVDIYTPNYDGKIDRAKMLSMLRVNSDVTTGSVLQMRYSDDDYQNWSNFQTFDLGIERPFVTDLGTFYRRAFHFRHQCNTDFRIKSIDLQMDIGTL